MAMSQFIPLAELKLLLKENHVDERFKGQARSRLIFSALLEPFRRYEQLRYGSLMKHTQLKQPPVFLLGYGRSGTTHLHYLFSKDTRFGVLTNYQAATHPVSLIGRGWLEKILQIMMPSTRPMDNVALTLDSPQEEELALLNITRHASLHFLSFPKNLADYDRYVCQLGKDAKDLKIWQKAYMEVLKKATILSGGKRLALKTPTNTGRLNILNDMFPGAKYVNIVRNPYRVYQSMLNMYRKILPDETLQDFEWESIDSWVLDCYSSMMQKYLRDRNLINPSDLIEIKYEDLDERPMEILPAIYTQLQLGDFEQARPALESYLDSLGTFEKNSFQFPDEVIEKVNKHWGFAFEAFGYKKLETEKGFEIEAA